MLLQRLDGGKRTNQLNHPNPLVLYCVQCYLS